MCFSPCVGCSVSSARSAIPSSKGAAHRHVPPPETAALRDWNSLAKILLLRLQLFSAPVRSWNKLPFPARGNVFVLVAINKDIQPVQWPVYLVSCLSAVFPSLLQGRDLPQAACALCSLKPTCELLGNVNVIGKCRVCSLRAQIFPAAPRL